MTDMTIDELNDWADQQIGVVDTARPLAELQEQHADALPADVGTPNVGGKAHLIRWPQDMTPYEQIVWDRWVDVVRNHVDGGPDVDVSAEWPLSGTVPPRDR